MNENQNVPYIMHEADMARMERANKRLWIVVIILIAALLGTNAAWIVYESQYQTVDTTIQDVQQEADNQSINNFIGGDSYGKPSEGDDNTYKNQSEEGRNVE